MSIIWAAAHVPVQLVCDLMAGVGIVKISSGIFKMACQELTCKTLLEDIEAKLPSIEFHQRMANSGRGDSGPTEDETSQFFVEVRRVLHRVVQVHFAAAMKQPVRLEFGKAEREAGLVVDRPKAAHRAFKMNRDFTRFFVSFLQYAMDILSGLLAQRDDRVRRELDGQPQHLALARPLLLQICGAPGGSLALELQPQAEPGTKQKLPI